MNVAELVKNAISSEQTESSDTFHIWENYKEQATLWRVLALAQLLTTPIIILLCFYIYSTRTVTLQVPAQPLPGEYRTDQIPKSIFISRGTEFVNLVASYQPAVARKQFLLGAEMLDGVALQKFQEESLELELNAIENTQRTQMYFVDPARTTVKYKRGHVFVTFYGLRTKFISGQELPSSEMKFQLTMKTIPRQTLNRYGIVIVDFTSENVL